MNMSEESTAWKFDGLEDIIDSRDIVERIEELEAFTEDNPEEACTEEGRNRARELKALKALEAEASSSPDWNYGETLIRESYFEEYIEQLIDDCYPEVSKALSSGEWPMRHLKLDIEDAANEAKADYFDVEFNGSTYLIRG